MSYQLIGVWTCVSSVFLSLYGAESNVVAMLYLLSAVFMGIGAFEEYKERE